MADDTVPPNTLTTGVKGRSTARGDVPDALRRRYYTDDRGGAGLGFYVDATVKAPAFRDEGRRLVAARADPGAIRDMALIARHRGWTIVMARGSDEFRREAWLAGRAMGLEVRGYRPTERDVQELDRRIDRRLTGRDRARRGGDEPLHGDPLEPEGDAGAHSRLRVVKAVVRDRIQDPAVRERILAGARDRIAGWLERGARFEPVGVRRPPDRNAEPPRAPGRTRDR